MDETPIYHLTTDEAAIAAQLICIRRELALLQIEERTHEDALLAILRGHGVQTARGKDPYRAVPLAIARRTQDRQETIVIDERGDTRPL